MPRLRSAGLLLLVSTTLACTKNGGPMEIFAPPSPPEVAYVSPDGGDAADGTENAPFATIARALNTNRPRIVLFAGSYPEPEVVVSRAVQIDGATDGRSVLQGHLFIAASNVVIRRVDVTGGVGVHLARAVRVESASVAYGAKDDTVSVVSSEVELHDLQLSCGPETCVQATTATVGMSQLRARAEAGSKRVIRIESSSASVARSSIAGGGITQVQASLGSHLTIETSTLADSGGNGLAALQQSVLVARGLRVTGCQKIGLLVSRSVARVADAYLGGTPSLTVGVTGADLELVSSTVAASRDGALSLSMYNRLPSKVTLRRTAVFHGPFDGVLVSGGHLAVVDGRFEGDGAPGSGDQRGDGIVAQGEASTVDVRTTRFVRPRGFAIALVSDASGTVSATISEPGLGGIIVDDVAVDAVEVNGSVVQGCRSGSGIVALASPRVQVVGGRVTGCPEAGYLAGQSALLTVRGAQASQNAQYGFAAFGGSTVVLEDSRAEGGLWAAFAACGDGSRIDVREGVELVGQTVLCP